MPLAGSHLGSHCTDQLLGQDAGGNKHEIIAACE